MKSKNQKRIEAIARFERDIAARNERLEGKQKGKGRKKKAPKVSDETVEHYADKNRKAETTILNTMARMKV